MECQLSDEVLIKRFQAGDTKVFAILVERYQSRISRLVNRYIKDMDETQDVVQEVFLRTYHALPQFLFQSHFYSWLYRIAINTSINYLGKKSVPCYSMSEFLDEDNEFIEEGVCVDGPEDIIRCEEIEGVLAKAVEDLPQLMKRVIILREMFGLSYEEIAEQLHCPVGTIRSRLARARTVLEEKLNPYLQ